MYQLLDFASVQRNISTIVENIEPPANESQARPLTRLEPEQQPVAAIPARIMDVDPLTAELLEIDENLRRNELTKLEEGEHIARREEILIERGLRAKRGGQVGNKNWAGGHDRDECDRLSHSSLGNGDEPVNSVESLVFTPDIGAEIGLSARTVQRRTKAARNIAPDVRDRLKAVDQERERDKMITDNATQPLQPWAKARGALITVDDY